jgi:hypothetical protein
MNETARLQPAGERRKFWIVAHAPFHAQGPHDIERRRIRQRHHEKNVEDRGRRD